MSPRRLQGIGLLLFLFIPLVLFLFVRHPRPIGLSLAAGVILMLGHRRLARPYFFRVLPQKCAWCNRVPPAGEEALLLQSGTAAHEARCCQGHRDPALRFFAHVARWRFLLGAGIFLPLLLLLGTLAAAAFGRDGFLPTATAIFQLTVGVTVNLAALGTVLGPRVSPVTPVRVPFPIHNFFLLGVRILLWIFRLVGIWWIWVGIHALSSSSI